MVALLGSGEYRAAADAQLLRRIATDATARPRATEFRGELKRIILLSLYVVKMIRVHNLRTGKRPFAHVSHAIYFESCSPLVGCLVVLTRIAACRMAGWATQACVSRGVQLYSRTT